MDTDNSIILRPSYAHQAVNVGFIATFLGSGLFLTARSVFLLAVGNSSMISTQMFGHVVLACLGVCVAFLGMSGFGQMRRQTTLNSEGVTFAHKAYPWSAETKISIPWSRIREVHIWNIRGSVVPAGVVAEPDDGKTSYRRLDQRGDMHSAMEIIRQHVPEDIIKNWKPRDLQ